MPIVKPPVTPQATAPVAAMTEQKRPVQTRMNDTGATFDTQANLVRTSTGIASPGKAPKIKPLVTATPEFKGNGELKKMPTAQQMANKNAQITAENAQNVQRSQDQAVRNARRRRTTGGMATGPSVFGPSLGTAGSRADNPPDFPFFKVT